MIQLRKLTLALPFAFVAAACSSNRSSGDTGTAAGSIANDTAARLDTNPVPGIVTGGTDTSAKAMPTDTTMKKDSAMMDSTKRDSMRRHHAAKKTKKPY